MPIYRFYTLTSGKRIATPGADQVFDSDARAHAHAKTLANGHAVGVWHGPRFVVYVSGYDSCENLPRFRARIAESPRRDSD